MPHYIKMPSGDIYSSNRVGASKANGTYWVLLDAISGRTLEIQTVPAEVGILWRDELGKLLISIDHRPDRPVRQIDWEGLAREVDPVWAEKTYGRSAAEIEAEAEASRAASAARHAPATRPQKPGDAAE